MRLTLIFIQEYRKAKGSYTERHTIIETYRNRNMLVVCIERYTIVETCKEGIYKKTCREGNF